MENLRRKTILLGGSNSVLKNGLSSGLSFESDLLNLSLGASSSLQNLYEIIRHSEVINSIDLIVSESNINDYHNNGHLDSKVPIDIIVGNIVRYYRYLANFRHKTIVILFPMTIDFDNRKLIYEQHKENLVRYGIPYIDLHEQFKNGNMLNSVDDHPPVALMYNLGCFLVRFLEQIDFPSPASEFIDKDRYYIWNPKYTVNKKIRFLVKK